MSCDISCMVLVAKMGIDLIVDLGKRSGSQKKSHAYVQPQLRKSQKKHGPNRWLAFVKPINDKEYIRIKETSQITNIR